MRVGGTDAQPSIIEALDKPMLVVYHANCPDGFCAAWVASKSLPKNTEFYAAHYGGELPDFADRNVIFVDWCPKSYQMCLLEVAKSVICIDHHITAKAEIEQLGGNCDISKSGAMLTWEYFNKDAPAPLLIEYVQDRDLWNWKLKYSKEVSAALSTIPKTFEAWDKFNDFGLQEWAKMGMGVVSYQEQLIEQHIKHAKLQRVCGYDVLVCNATCLSSEIGERLSKGMPFGATYFDRADGKREWSLRSSEGGIHVGDLAKTMGGGGHAPAAGFETILNFPPTYDTNMV